jgi:hypothetical protein
MKKYGEGCWSRPVIFGLTLVLLNPVLRIIHRVNMGLLQFT